MGNVKNLIIGAGPAGLATAARLRQANIDFEILEKSHQVANSWHNHYDRLHLHTVKQWSHLPYMPFPENYPTYVSRGQLVDYLEQYANKFDIRPRFGNEIISIKKSNDQWLSETIEGETYLAENLIIATGLNRVPYLPSWEGQESFGGRIVHSINYKNPQPYIGQKVLVVGIGNTGAEVALDLAEHNVGTYIAVRGEITVVPRDLNGQPVQVTAKQLEKLPFGLGDWLGTQIRKVYFGNLSKYGLKPSKESPIVLLRETGKTPLIDIGTIATIKAGKIKVVGEISHFTETGVHFKENGFEAFDSVILATGYSAKIEDIIEYGTALLDSQGWPQKPVADGEFVGLYFVGFDNYKTGGLLGTINNDSEIVVNAIKTKENEV